MTRSEQILFGSVLIILGIVSIFIAAFNLKSSAAYLSVLAVSIWTIVCGVHYIDT